MTEANLGIIAENRGDAAAALDHFGRALHSSEKTNDERQTVLVLVNYSYLLAKQERHSDAEGAVSRGLALARVHHDLLSEGMFEENRAEVRLRRGDLEEAYPSILRAY